MQDHHGSTELVGRETQGRLLDSALRLTLAGESQVLVLGGEAGIGKTRLADQIAATARAAGVRVLTGSCVPLGADRLPLAPVLEALRGLADEIGRERIAALVRGGRLTRLIPGLQLSPDAGEPDAADGLFPELVGLFERLLTDRPLVLIVEDLHWSDRSTREILDVLARGMRQTSLLIVVTCRTEGNRQPEAVRGFLGEWDRLRHVTRIELGPLSRTETLAMVSNLLESLPAAEAAERIFRRSAGNPFFIEQLARMETASEPQTIDNSLRDVLTTQIERLDRISRRVVQIAALGAHRIPHRLLAAVATMPEEQLLGAIRQAVDFGVLSVEGDDYGFRHSLLRDAVVQSTLPGERIEIHRRYAHALEDVPSLVPALEQPSELAHHWWRVGDADRAVPSLLTAADAAGRIFAHSERVTMLKCALDFWPKLSEPRSDLADVLDEVIDAAMYSGQHALAVDLIDRALTSAPVGDHSERTALLTAKRGGCLMSLGDQRAGEVLYEAVRMAPSGISDIRASILSLSAFALASAGDSQYAADLARESMQLGQDLGDARIEVRARTALGLALGHAGLDDASIEEVKVALALADLHDDRHGAVIAYDVLCHMLMSIGLLDEVLEVAPAGLALARETGLLRTEYCRIANSLASALIDLGRWDDAERQLMEIVDVDHPGAFAASPRLSLADLALARGDLDTTRQFLAWADQLLNHSQLDQESLVTRACLSAEIALADHRVDEAVGAVIAGLALPGAPAHVSASWRLLNTGARVESAAALSRTLRPDAVDRTFRSTMQDLAGKLRTDRPQWVASAQQFDAELDSGISPSPLWTGAAASWEVAGHPYPLALSLLRAAEVALNAGDKAFASRNLGRALKICELLDARLLATEIQHLAKRSRVLIADANPATAESGKPSAEQVGLTSREAEVLRLLSEGFSNNDIATTLYMSSKTASVHVSRILHKLSVKTRGEAAAMAYRLRLFDRQHD
ncbi:helix-turn-helix transcriptional regulator [Kribbella kalugense]|uniref:helix-turn-helix transcriptional regulator n=1 Tax=Kribbella kalugense TaxID=2512221 RepID=UPI001416FF72|nr:AAA family ATPase [Kribbella kalugense]